MNSTLEHEPATEPMPSFDLAWHSNDYLKRIHWWVRLFGIVWIVIPVVAMIGGFFLFLGAASSANHPSAYDKCIDRGLLSASDCAEMYGR